MRGWTSCLWLLPSLVQVTWADSKTDLSRLGTEYTLMPLYRGEGGTNVLTLGIGTPAQDFNLTLSTNVEFMIVGSDVCTECISDSDLYDADDSTSFTGSAQALSYTAIYPGGSSDLLRVSGTLIRDTLTDERGTDKGRVIALTSSVEDVSQNLAGSSPTSFSDGTSGFWGIGIYEPHPSYSLIGAMLASQGDGAPSQATSFTVGFDIANRSSDLSVDAGSVHWGGAPQASYSGSFNWLDVDTTKAAGWAFDLNSIQLDSAVESNSSLYATVDPGFDGIYMPTHAAEKLMAAVADSRRDTQDPTRWVVPCDTNLSMIVDIGGYQYKVGSTELVQPRTNGGAGCWSSVIAWQNGSTAEQIGEVRLGTPFLAGVYVALYYSTDERYVGIAGKPNSVNALKVPHKSDGHRNSKLAGILIGSLLAVLVLLFLICYSRNRNSFQSIWYRAIRRQHRAQMNAVVRAATLPPPFATPPSVFPIPQGYAPVPGGPMGPMGPVAPGPMGFVGPMGPMGPMPYPHPQSMGQAYRPGFGYPGYGYQPPPYQAPFFSQGPQLGPQAGPSYSRGLPLPRTSTEGTESLDPARQAYQGGLGVAAGNERDRGRRHSMPVVTAPQPTPGIKRSRRQSSNPVMPILPEDGANQTPPPVIKDPIASHTRRPSASVDSMGVPRRASRAHMRQDSIGDVKAYNEWAQQQSQSPPDRSPPRPAAHLQGDMQYAETAPPAPGWVQTPHAEKKWYRPTSRSSLQPTYSAVPQSRPHDSSTLISGANTQMAGEGWMNMPQNGSEEGRRGFLKGLMTGDTRGRFPRWSSRGNDRRREAQGLVDGGPQQQGEWYR